MKEGHFWGLVIAAVLAALIAWFAAAVRHEIYLDEQRIEFAKACEERDKSFAMINGAWTCITYSVPAE